MDSFVVKHGEECYIVLDHFSYENYLVANTTTHKFTVVGISFLQDSEYKGLCGD